MLSPFQSLEREWRVELSPADWTSLKAAASATPGVIIGSGRVCDLVLGRHGFDSVALDGYIVRLRGPGTYRLELKERLGEEEWHETSTEIGSPDAALAILKRLGLTAHLLIDRWRSTVETTGYTLCFDNVSNLGHFVEVEFGTPIEGELDALASVVAALEALPRLPPYGDIVRNRLGNKEFRARFEQCLRDFAFP